MNARGSLLAVNNQKSLKKTLGLSCVLVLSLGASGCDQLWEEWKEQTENLPAADLLAPDADGDRLPDDFDCAPDDPAVNKTARRNCTLPSGEEGEQLCYYGVWSSCAEVPDQDCSAGETREVGCELCGVQTEECVDGEWEAQGECRDQKACEPGETFDHSVRATMTCGSAIRLTFTCNDRCEWGDDYSKKEVFAGCQEDQCCDGMNCGSAPFRTGCEPINDRIAHLESEGPIIYPEHPR